MGATAVCLVDCTPPPAVCGNEEIESGETCDDGNTDPGDGCDASCLIEVPAGWTCDPTYYGVDDGCDCGCGALDSDCLADNTASSCDFCTACGAPGTADCARWVETSDNSTCVVATCGDDLAEAEEMCDGTDMATFVGMTCDDINGDNFGTGTLSCKDNCRLELSGCSYSCGNDVQEGFEDCDGTDMGLYDGNTCVDLGYGGGTLGCTNCGLSGCTDSPAPMGWTCLPAFYDAADGCDCGCGVIDPDCAGDATVEACTYCSGSGSCGDPNELGCPANINASDNSICD